MARGKKKETVLSPEERLQAALVPESEQPYKVPENWCWTRIINLCFLSNGKAFKPKDWTQTGIPIVRIQNLNNPEAEYNLYSGAVEDNFRLCGGELLFAWSGTPGTSFGAHIWWGNEAVLNQHIFRVDFDERYINKVYFKYAINQQLDMLISVAHGGAGLQHVTKGVFEATPIPLPPFAEQQRIVDRIESLFAKLDEAKQKAQDALDSFETRKAAILHKAFTGELTAQWRKEHSVGMESWEEKTLESVCNSIFDGDHMPPPKSEQGIPFLVISNVNTGHVSFEDTRFVPKSYYEALSDTRKPQYGDVLYTLVGSYGIPVIVDSEIPFCFQRHMALLKPKDINSYYLWYILQSREMFEKATDIATGTAQLTVPIKGLRKLKFNCAPTDEQTEIVHILDDLLAKEQQAEEAAEKVLEQIDLTKKAILARAFRGELGTNDPSEESAVELLRAALK